MRSGQDCLWGANGDFLTKTQDFLANRNIKWLQIEV